MVVVLVGICVVCVLGRTGIALDENRAIWEPRKMQLSPFTTCLKTFLLHGEACLLSESRTKGAVIGSYCLRTAQAASGRLWPRATNHLGIYLSTYPNRAPTDSPAAAASSSAETLGGSDDDAGWFISVEKSRRTPTNHVSQVFWVFSG